MSELRGQAPKPLRRRCIWCDGRGTLGGPAPCEHCCGSGQEIITRDEAWSRRKEFLGSAHPSADKGGNEKWPRYAAEVPPELAELIDAAHRKSLGVNVSAASRAGVVRAGLRLYLEAVDPESDVIEGTATDHIDLPALGGGSDV